MALLLVMAVVVGITAKTESSALAVPHSCAQELGMSTPDATEAAKVPLLFVHGLWSRSDVWSEGSASMMDAVRAEQVHAVTFDYESTNSTWVAEGDTADRLAKTIVCYFLLYDEKVVVGAHSMGGLLARQSLSKTAYGVRVQDAVGLVITIGTPHKGSQLGGVSYGANFSLCYMMLFGQWDAARLCNTAESTKAVSAMRPGSPELASLPHFPDSVAVKAIAGEVKQESICLKWVNVCLRGRSTGGDMVVAVSSATAEYTTRGMGDGKKVFACTTAVVVPWAAPWCGHKEMLGARRVQDEVAASLREYLAAQPDPGPQPSATPTPGASATPVPYP
ncbi:alpha/beta fold hydrolase [Streptomyces caniscabiei]|uniref:esterase/lipase family protein n=1 Tax=Streptomyces caniscabiei TaxID=2746961 RepID=UPI0029BD53C8|nr:alpha/beta fold hydrolase [Streptomyces caniscabiei]MDX2776571.1 alpha/beta fold hydrolase [Streptomyces caniscabiei]